MITERPLKEVPTKALYALHRGIEKQTGLIRVAWADSCGGRCALGSLGIGFETYAIDLVKRCSEIGLSCHADEYGHPEFGDDGLAISVLNSSCGGTPEERREFMLRHIVEELRHRGKSVENFKLNDGCKNAGASYVDKFVKDFHNLDT